MTHPGPLITALDTALDRSVVLGYTRLGSRLRRRWWPADPEQGALTGKRVLVTGATSGIGEAMVSSFADLGATVHLLGRNPDKLRAVADRKRVEHPGTELVEELCDVGDLDAVREWAAGFTTRVEELHGLVHNAGTMLPERTETRQGHEVNLAAHVLGPHLITERLLGPLRAGGAMVVWMSSGGMYGARLATEDLEYERGDYDGVRAYARTKRMQVVLADAWASRLASSGVDVASTHPGWVRTSGVATSLPTFDKVMRPFLRDVEDGADTTVWLVATRPPAEGPHHFWHDRSQRPTTFGWQRPQDPEAVRRFLTQVCDKTATPDTW